MELKTYYIYWRGTLVKNSTMEGKESNYSKIVVPSPSLTLKRRSSLKIEVVKNSEFSRIPDDRVSLASLSGDDDNDNDDSRNSLSLADIAASKSGNDGTSRRSHSKTSSPPPPPAPSSTPVAIKRSIDKYRISSGSTPTMFPPPPPPAAAPTSLRKEEISDFDFDIEVEEEMDGFSSYNEEKELQNEKERQQFTTVRDALNESTSSEDSSSSDDDATVRPPPRRNSNKYSIGEQKTMLSGKEEEKTFDDTINKEERDNKQLMKELEVLREEMKEIKALATARRDDEINKEEIQRRKELYKEKKKLQQQWRKNQYNKIKKNASFATKKLIQKVHDSPLLVKANQNCHTMVCQHCTPWCCLKTHISDYHDDNRSNSSDYRLYLGQKIYARSIVSIGWLHFIISFLFGFIAIITLMTMSYNKRIHSTTYGFSLLFLSAIKSTTLLCGK